MEINLEAAIIRLRRETAKQEQTITRQQLQIDEQNAKLDLQSAKIQLLQESRSRLLATNHIFRECITKILLIEPDHAGLHHHCPICIAKESLRRSA